MRFLIFEWEVFVINIWFIIFSGLLMVSCVVLVVLILMQKKRASGIGGAIGGMGSQQTFWDKNKGRSLEGKLEKYTKILGAIMMVLALLLNFAFFL